MTTAQHLTAMASLLRQGHCCGALARDERGLIVHPTDEAARSWCIVGASMRACAHPADSELALLAVKAAMSLSFDGGPTGIAPRQDAMTQDEVVALVERARAVIQ